MKVRVERPRLGRIFEQGEILGQGIEFFKVRLLTDKEIFRAVPGARKLVDDVADVSADSEITGAPDIDRNTHRYRRSARGAAAPGQRRREVPAPRVQRELHGKLRNLGANAPLALG